MNLGEKIKKLRTEKNLTQEDFADKLYVTRTAVSKWETNNGYPSIDILKSIANLFNITIDELLSDEDINNKKNLDKTKFKTHNIISLIGFSISLVSIICLIFIKNKLLLGCLTATSILGACLYLTFTELALTYYKDKKISNKQQYFNSFREISAGILLFLIIYTFIRQI